LPNPQGDAVASRPQKPEPAPAGQKKPSTDAERAMLDAQAEARRIDENTVRLRALRLAKEAKDREEAARNPPKPKAKPKATAKAKPKARTIPLRKLNAENDG
jgi:hypothetical protein